MFFLTDLATYYHVFSVLLLLLICIIKDLINEMFVELHTTSYGMHVTII